MYSPLFLETAPAKGVLAVAQQGIQVSALPGELLLQLDRPSHQHLRNTVAHNLATIAGAGASALRKSWRGLDAEVVTMRPQTHWCTTAARVLGRWKKEPTGIERGT